MTPEQLKSEIWERIGFIERVANDEELTDTDRIDILVKQLGYEWVQLFEMFETSQITGMDLYAQLIAKELERLERL